MPFESVSDPGLRGDIAEPPAAPGTRTLGDVAIAAFQKHNTVVSALSAMRNSGEFTPDPSHNPLDVIRGTPYEQRHLDRFPGARSEGETRAIMRQIDGEEANDRTLDANGVSGFLLGMLAGTADPTIALPGSIAVRAGRAGMTFGRAAVEVGLGGAVQSAAQEVALQASQETRTPGESALNIGSATLLAGIIGGAASKLLTPVEHARAVQSLDRERAAMDAHAGNAPRTGTEQADALRAKLGLAGEPVGTPPALVPGEAGGAVAAPAGAAASDTRELRMVSYGLDKIPGLGDLTERLAPTTRLMGSESVATRRIAADLAEMPFRFEENAAGVATTQGPALDRSARLELYQAKIVTGDELSRLFADYRFGDAETSAPRLRAGAQDMLGRADGRMSFSQFKAEVSDAMRNGDRHAISQVQQAAQFLRSKAIEPYKERAIAAGLFPEDVKPVGAESYLTRVYNRQAIAAKRPEFADRVTNHLERDQATKAAAKDRLAGLNDELNAAQTALEKAKSPDAAAAAQLRHDQARTKIEEEIAAWDGKSASEAKSAIKAREKYAAERAREADAPRLKSADSAIDATVASILKSDRDLSRQELRGHADDITDRILGSPDGRLPYDAHIGTPARGGFAGGGEQPRGALAERRFAIPDAEIKDFLEHDVEHVINTYLNTMVPDVLLTERFGDVEMSEAFRKINDEYAALATSAKSEKARTKLEKERQGVIRDVAAIRDRIRGVYGLTPEGPVRQAARVTAAVKNFNVLTSMGMATVSSLTDMAGPVIRHGLTSTFSDAWAPWFRSLTGGSDAYKAAKTQFRAMGIGVETTLGSRQHAISDIMDTYKPQSRVERTLQWTADKFFIANLLGPWTDWAKTTASLVASSEMLRAASAVSKGSATKRQITNLAEAGVDAAMARRIWSQFEAGGEVRDGVHLPNTADWTDKTARAAFEGAIARDADIAVITPGQEKPLWLSTPVLSVLGQFKSFTAASTQRMLIANLQRRDAQVLQGVMFSLSLGMLSYKINSVLGGQPVSDKPADWVKEGISRANFLGWLEEGNAMASKATRGSVDIYRMLGSEHPLSRYASRGAIDQLLGPTAGKLESLLKITGGAAKADWNQADTHAVRMLTAGQNLFFLRNLLNQVEAGANNAFGIPMKEPAAR
jgi:hypothetical protein